MTGTRRPHTLVINYSYEVPNLSRKWNNIVAKAVFDNWQVSGITSILSGTRQGFTYGYTGVPTGDADRHGRDQRRRQPGRHPVRSEPAARRAHVRPAVPHRVHRAADRPVPAGQRRLNDEYLGPGFMNWDISFFKNIPMGGARRLQFRLELYNAFNTDQWTARRHRARSSTICTGAADRRDVRQADRRDVQRAAHPARRAVHVLIDT